jgi:hypothetical protein
VLTTGAVVVLGLPLSVVVGPVVVAVAVVVCDLVNLVVSVPDLYTAFGSAANCSWISWRGATSSPPEVSVAMRAVYPP